MEACAAGAPVNPVYRRVQPEKSEASPDRAGSVRVVTTVILPKEGVAKVGFPPAVILAKAGIHLAIDFLFHRNNGNSLTVNC